MLAVHVNVSTEDLNSPAKISSGESDCRAAKVQMEKSGREIPQSSLLYLLSTPEGCLEP